MSKIWFLICWLFIGVIQACLFDLVMFILGQLQNHSTSLWGLDLFPYWWLIAAIVSFIETLLFRNKLLIWFLGGFGGPGLGLPE